jgi:hypothetical protein
MTKSRRSLSRVKYRRRSTPIAIFHAHLHLALLSSGATETIWGSVRFRLRASSDRSRPAKDRITRTARNGRANGRKKKVSGAESIAMCFRDNSRVDLSRISPRDCATGGPTRQYLIAHSIGAAEYFRRIRSRDQFCSHEDLYSARHWLCPPSGPNVALLRRHKYLRHSLVRLATERIRAWPKFEAHRTELTFCAMLEGGTRV